MTRRGSLAYYLASWMCGCFFMALGFWTDIHWIRIPSSQGGLSDVGFLGLCFFGLILGAVPSLLFGWLLRKLVKIFHAERIWVWMTAGAGLALLLVWLLGGLAHLARDPRVSSLRRFACLAVLDYGASVCSRGEPLGHASGRRRNCSSALRSPPGICSRTRAASLTSATLLTQRRVGSESTH